MEFDDTQETNLHYLMLQYLYEKQNLASSCFSHCWEDFKSLNPSVSISAGKMIQDDHQHDFIFNQF
jgi:hypothetical protein